jgi:hypothetical protein
MNHIIAKFAHMLKGAVRTEIDWIDYYPEQFREENYYYSLVAFEGVDGTSYGIIDELHDLDRLIERIGHTVVKEEREFKDVEKVIDPEDPFPSEEVLKLWHKKMYRQFTYKSMMMLIYTTFETGIVDFYNLLVVEGRKADSLRRKNVLDILEV